MKAFFGTFYRPLLSNLVHGAIIFARSVNREHALPILQIKEGDPSAWARQSEPDRVPSSSVGVH